MKRISICVAALILLAYSCTKSSGPGNTTGGGTNNGGGGGSTTYTPSCTGAAINFTSDVFPIFQTVCSQSGCHNSGSLNGPGPLTNYAQISAAKVNIRAVILSGVMPKNTTLSNAQRNTIICWIDAGAANN